LPRARFSFNCGRAFGALKGVGDFIAYTHFGYALAYLGAFLAWPEPFLLGACIIFAASLRCFGLAENVLPEVIFSHHQYRTVLIVFGICPGWTNVGRALQDASLPFLLIISTVKRTSPGGIAILGFSPSVGRRSASEYLQTSLLALLRNFAVAPPM